MKLERMEMIPEEDEHQEEREQEIEGAPDLESRLEPQEPKEPQEPEQRGNSPGNRNPPSTPARNPRGKVRKLTDFFNTLGGSGTPKTPSKTAKNLNLNTLKKSGGVKKPTRRKNKAKIEEPQRAKMEEAMRKFLNKSPD